MLNNKNEIIDLELELSTICNADCPLCYRNYKSFENHYPKQTVRELKDLIKDIESYKNLKYIRLVGSISEPTLYKDFFPLIKYIKEKNIMIEICTNGSTHDIKWWKELGKLLTLEDRVYFTICGSTQEIHSRYRRKTNLNKILENAKALRSIIKIDYAQCIEFYYNSDDLKSDKFNNLIKDFSFKYFTKTFYPKETDNYKNQNVSDFFPNAKELSKYKTVYELACKFPFKKRKCQAYEGKWNQIDVYGNVYPCYLFLEGLRGQKWDQDWSKILNGKYEVCKFCSKFLRKYIDKNNLMYII